MKLQTAACFALLFGLSGQDAFAAKNPPVVPDRLNESLRVDFWYGGWEADYTKSAYELMFSYRDLGNLHLFAGFGNARQIYYDRSKIYAGGYLFFDSNSYLKTFVTRKTYEYPIDPTTLTVNPDSSSYHKEPKLEFELSHRFDEILLGRVSYEISHPSIFHDPGASVTNHKLGSEIIVSTPLSGLHTKIYAAMLHDPDPNLTEIKGRDNPRTALGTASTTKVIYKNSYLFGGAIEYVRDKWEIEVKLLQNRDLDNSYKYTLLNKFIYRIDDDRQFQIDFLHDEFSSQSNYSGLTANVHLYSYYQRYSPRLKYGLGFKRIDVPGRTDDTGFVFVQVNTGALLK